MKKIGIIVDSSCGLTKAEAEKKGWGFIPLIANIDGKDYMDGIDLDANKYYKMIKIEHDVRTSATTPGVIVEVIKKASTEFENVIVYGISTQLSSQTQNVSTFAKEFKNVSVIESKNVGYSIVRDIEEALSESNDFDIVVKRINELTKKSWGLVFPFSLKWLVKGGRTSSAAASMANLLKIVPIISFENGGLDKYGKGRSYSKTIIKQAKAMNDKFPNGEFIIYKGRFDGQEKLIEEIEKILNISEIVYFPPVIANHTGPEVLALMVRQK